MFALNPLTGKSPPTGDTVQVTAAVFPVVKLSSRERANSARIRRKRQADIQVPSRCPTCRSPGSRPTSRTVAPKKTGNAISSHGA